jgi:transcriptional regulator with PAS, ATPase and Fis domain
MTFDRHVTTGTSSDHTFLDQTIIGQNPAMLEIKRRVLHLSQSDLTVCITGESGTGKELVAHALHNLSPRRHKPFVKINCAAIPPTLFESELFGFEKGAFTGALQRKQGKFELACSGTVFLDEIAEIPMSLQGKLLHVLEDKELSALGSTVSTSIDVRVVVATNADLNHMVSSKRFRADLFYRIMAAPIQMPPLRRRKEDIQCLCDHFLLKHTASYGGSCKPLSVPLRERFHQYDWPGNVRELENTILSFVAVGDAEPFWKKEMNSVESFTLKEVCREAVRKAESQIISDALSHTNWNRRKAAALLQTSYRTLLNKLKEYDIRHHR